MNTKKLLLMLVCSTLFLVYADDASLLTDNADTGEDPKRFNKEELEVDSQKLEVPEDNVYLTGREELSKTERKTPAELTCDTLNEQVAQYIYDQMLKGQELDDLVNNLPPQQSADLVAVLDNLKKLALEGHFACIRSMGNHKDTERVHDTVKVLPFLKPQETYQRRIVNNKVLVGTSGVAGLILGGLIGKAFS